MIVATYARRVWQLPISINDPAVDLRFGKQF